jgi:hypothetical protein
MPSKPTANMMPEMCNTRPGLNVAGITGKNGTRATASPTTGLEKNGEQRVLFFPSKVLRLPKSLRNCQLNNWIKQRTV